MFSAHFPFIFGGSFDLHLLPYIFFLTRSQEAVAQTRSVKKMFLEISQNSQENTCAKVYFLIIANVACNFIKKETLAQVFSCEFCEIYKNTFFHRTPLVAASGSQNNVQRIICAEERKNSVLLYDDVYLTGGYIVILCVSRIRVKENVE